MTVGWDESLSLGALKVPNPALINPHLRVLHIYGIRGVVNEGVFREGEVLVVNDRTVYNQFHDDNWQPAELPDEFKPKETDVSNGAS